MGSPEGRAPPVTTRSVIGGLAAARGAARIFLTGTRSEDGTGDAETGRGTEGCRTVGAGLLDRLFFSLGHPRRRGLHDHAARAPASAHRRVEPPHGFNLLLHTAHTLA